RDLEVILGGLDLELLDQFTDHVALLEGEVDRPGACRDPRVRSLRVAGDGGEQNGTKRQSKSSRDALHELGPCGVGAHRQINRQQREKVPLRLPRNATTPA